MAFAGLHKYAVKFLLSLAIIGAALLIGVYFLLQWHLDAPGPLDAEIVIDIPKGSSSRAIVRQLAERNIINYPLLFSAQLWLQHNNQRLQAGEYSFTPHVSVKDTITKLTKGEVVLHKFIIVEGLTSHTILENLRANELLTGEIMDSMPEATLLPETYYFTKGEKRTALLERAATNLHEFINKSWAERDLHPNINSINELLTLASIVEKETSLAEERPLVACVFLNRLKLNMRLQADPTVLYAITQGKLRLERPLSKGDLKYASPYNTYYANGLPPGPIAHPGAAAILAVLHPATSDALYFVARGDGSHVFSNKLVDHQNYVKQLRNLEKQRLK